MKNIEVIKQGPAIWNKWIEENRDPKNLDFSNSDLQGLNMYDLKHRPDNDYYIANLENAKFLNCDLSGANFRLIKLNGANFRNAKLDHANFSKANCENAQFDGAQLTNSSFNFAIINKANFQGADLSGASFQIREGENFDLHGAKINDLKLPPLDPLINANFDITFFCLVFARNLHNVHESSQEFALDYIKKTFYELHRERQPKDMELYFSGGAVKLVKTSNQLIERSSPIFFQKVLEKVQFLQSVFHEREIGNEIVTFSKHINEELIKYLKKNPHSLHKIHWRAFEELVADILTDFGWKIELTKETKDGGYDLFGIYKDQSGLRHTWLVECKKWDPERKIGIEVVRSLYAVKTDLRVGNALLATTSFFTKGVEDFKASHYDFQTRDFLGIVDWLNSYKADEGNKLIIKNNRFIHW